MPISADEFKNRASQNLRIPIDQRIYEMLGDGKAYSFDEIYKQIWGNPSEKSKNQSIINTIDKGFSLANEFSLSIILTKMVYQGKIDLQYIEEKNETYYMRTDLIK